MNIVVKRIMTIYATVFIILASCSPTLRTEKHVTLLPHEYRTESAAIFLDVTEPKPLPIVQSDTDKINKPRIIKLVKDGILPPYDTLLKRMFWYQQGYMRAVDSARHRGKKNDSLGYVLNQLRSVVANQRSDHEAAAKFYTQMNKSRLEAEQNKTYNQFIDWQVYAALSLIIIFQLINTYLSNRTYRKLHNLNRA